MTNRKIKDIIKQGLAVLYRRDQKLIDDKTHEQSLAARLMCNLQQILPEWDVDVEFNRQGEKRETKTDSRGSARKPDIIIHKRGPDGPNLAVMLVKCEWNRQPREDVKIVR